MSQSTVIRVERLSKRFRKGTGPQFDRLSEVLQHWGASLLRRPFRPKTSKPDDQELWAIRDLTFDVYSGEVLGIVGNNGAGKSTLLKVLSRITHPTRGRVEIDGRVCSLLEVGTGFHSELSGRENIFLNGAILGMGRREIAQKFDAIVEFAGVGSFLDTQLKHYSSGMAIRLAFSVAAHLEPEILIIDEILAVGDVAFQKKCLSKMAEISQSGQTILFVSHNMAAISSLTTRCLLLRHGQKIADGPTEEVLSQYLGELAPGPAERRDLSVAPRVAGSGLEWRFTTLRIVHSVERLTSYDEFVLEIGYESRAALSGILIGIGISNMDGATVANVMSCEDRCLLECAAGEKGIITVRVPQSLLAPGRYVISLGATNHTSNMLDLVRDAMLLVITADAARHHWLQLHSNMGVLLAANWSVAADEA
jgi:lipopolysaccharide transport system ATP-binding protein